MNPQESPSDSVEKVLADHEILTRYIDRFNQLSASAADVHEATEAVRRLSNHELLAHFAYEEQHIFPALLAAKPSPRIARLVSALQAEHQSLQQEATRLNQLLLELDAAGTRPDRLDESLRGFVGRLQRHAARENELFPSLV